MKIVSPRPFGENRSGGTDRQSSQLFRATSGCYSVLTIALQKRSVHLRASTYVFLADTIECGVSGARLWIIRQDEEQKATTSSVWVHIRKMKNERNRERLSTCRIHLSLPRPDSCLFFCGSDRCVFLRPCFGALYFSMPITNGDGDTVHMRWNLMEMRLHRRSTLIDNENC